MDSRIEKYINNIDIDTWQELDRLGDYKTRVRLVYSGDGQGDFENRSYYTTIECLEDYMIHCDDQMKLALKELIKLKERQDCL